MVTDLACPKCLRAWCEVKDGKLVCKCGYSKDVIKTYEQLLAENAMLIKRIKELTNP